LSLERRPARVTNGSRYARAVTQRANLWVLALLVCVGTVACGDDDAPVPPADAGIDLGDSGEGDLGTDAGPPPPALCATCRRDADCAEGALCLLLDGGQRACGVPCGSDADCVGLGAPAVCREDLPGWPLQCRPTSETCIGSAAGSSCASVACTGRYAECVTFDVVGSVCTSECRVDADCPMGLRRCRARDDSAPDGPRVCVPDARAAGPSCAALVDAAGATRCDASGGCPTGQSCHGIGALRVCLAPPSASGVCAAGTVGAALPGGATACVPVGRDSDAEALGLARDCACLLGDPLALVDRGLAGVGRDRCTAAFSDELISLFGDAVAHDRFRLSFTDRIRGNWPAAVSLADSIASELDADLDAASPAGRAIEHAAALADLRLPPASTAADGELTVALTAALVAAGATPDAAEVATQVATVDAALAPDLARLFRAVAEALSLRARAIAPLGADALAYLDTGAGYLFAQHFTAPEVRRADVQGALLGDVELALLATAARDLADAANALGAHAGAAARLSFATPAGRIEVRGGTAADTYDDAAFHETLLLADLGGDDVYRFPAGANASLANGVALVVDVAGADLYGYDEVPIASDVGPAGSARLPSDADGRDPAVAGGSGPATRSRTARQGAGRLGVGMLLDLGTESDTYRSLRFSQGYASLGVGVLYDAGGDDTYTAEAASQGAAVGGLGLLIDRSGSDHYTAYAYAQGFGYVRGVGALADGAGDDAYLAVPDDVLYFSPQDPGGSNSSFSQGAGFGRRDDRTDGVPMSGGLGVLRDRAGDDTYDAAIFAQATGYWFGTGMLLDGAGADRYDARWYVQAGTAHFAAAVLIDDGVGDDLYGTSSRRLNMALGAGHDFSLAWLVDRGGSDTYVAPNLALGGGNAAGAGFFVDVAGDDHYTAASDLTLGNASVETVGDTLRGRAETLGVFLEGGGADVYARPSVTVTPADGTTWSQSLHTGEGERGFGLDTTGAPIGL
jgi:hypothetical protein